MSELGLFTGNVRDALGPNDATLPSSPSTFFRANMPRFGLYDSASDAGQVALATGVMTAVRIKLAAGDTITNISARSGATAANTPTNWWFALYSNAATPALLSQSADQTSTAWAANTTKTLALGTPQTITAGGYYWVAIMVTATTPPTLIGACTVAPIVTGEANLSVTSGSSLTATATATLASPTVKQFAPYVVLT
jgi:hypothetical protein